MDIHDQSSLISLRERCSALRAQLDRLNAACIEAIDWAYAQDEDNCPDWVDRMQMVMELQNEQK